MKKFKLLPSVIMLIICFLTLCTGVYCASVISVAINGDLSIIPADLSNLASVTLRSSSLVDATMTINDVTSQEHTSITYAKMELAENSIPDTSTIEVEISLKNIGSEPVGAFFAHKSTTIASGSYATDSDIVVYDTITESSTTQAKIYCTSYTPVASQETVTMKLKIKLIDTDMASIAKKIRYNLYVEEYVPTENYASATGLVKLPYNDITTITSSTFSYNVTTLTYLALPNTITGVGENSFPGATSLKGINIPTSIVTIGDSAFSFCSSLIVLDFSNCINLRTFGYSVFDGCQNLISVDFTRCIKLTEVGYEAFNSCVNLISVDFTECTSLTTIVGGAFANCKMLESITILSSVTSIEEDAFENCSLLNTVIIDSATIAKKYKTVTDTYEDYLLENATYVYVKSGLSVGAYLSNTSNYSKTTISSGEYSGYVLYTKK